jgi:hypothetical protein
MGQQGRSSADIKSYIRCRTIYLLRLETDLHKEYECTYPAGDYWAVRPLIAHVTFNEHVVATINTYNSTV